MSAVPPPPPPPFDILTNTTVLKSEKVSDGEWKITEIKSDPPAEPDLHSGNRKELQFDIAFGIGISGYYDFDDTEISISPTLGGSSIGPRYTAGLKTGIKFGIDLWAAKGEVRIFESGNKLKIGYTLGTWFTEKSDEAVLLDLGN